MSKLGVAKSMYKGLRTAGGGRMRSAGAVLKTVAGGIKKRHPKKIVAGLAGAAGAAGFAAGRKSKKK